MERPDLQHLFRPASVAVVGASDRPEKVGFKVLSNILTEGYRGKVYPVNPRADEILGVPVVKSIDELPDGVDVAVIVIPATLVLDAVMRCAARGIRFLPIITSGFSEIGNTDEERKVLAYALDHGMRILGPNIFGYHSAAASLNATFGPKGIRSGSVALITQSGALGVALMGKTAVEGMGLSAVVSLGNKTDLDEADLLDYLVEQPDTRIMMLYIEGVRDGEKLVGALQRTTRKKPVVVIKSGRSGRGAAAAASHTGSLAGSDEVFDAIMRQCNVLRADTVEEAIAWAKFFEGNALPGVEECLIITNGGGIGVLATDACERHGVRLSDDYAALSKAFSPVMPYFGSAKNPVDLTGQASLANYQSAFDAALAMPGVGSVISLYCETAMLNTDEFVPVLEGTFRKYQEAKKPLVFCLFGGRTTEEVIETLRQRGVPVFTDPNAAVSCMGALYRYARNLALPPEEPVRTELDREAIEQVVSEVWADGRRALYSMEARAIMEAAGITIPQSLVATNVLEAVKAANSIGYPVVMKVVSRDILHKSDVGGVALDLQNEKEVLEAYEAIHLSCRTRAPRAVIEGIEVMEMVQEGTELIVGARRDPSFGPVVMTGLGGIYVEVMKDVSFRALPVGRRQVLGMVKATRAYPLLLGVRGQEQKDIESLMDVIVKVGEIVRSCPGISDIEVNPVVVYPSGVKAVDVRVLVSRSDGCVEHE
ncbi:MAG: acetate--CoA ligase family protein [Euryarchaeota archaeon]|nr:acetate--CoA ligase family protein [Euryarchaeota archaeon]